MTRSYLNSTAVFEDHLLKLQGIAPESLPEMIFAVTPNDLRNVSPKDVLTYDWKEVSNLEEIDKIVAEGLPYIESFSYFYVGYQRSH